MHTLPLTNSSNSVEGPQGTSTTPQSGQRALQGVRDLLPLFSALFGILIPIVFLFARAVYSEFYGKLGLTPEDVGLGETHILAQTGAIIGLFLLIGSLAAATILAEVRFGDLIHLAPPHDLSGHEATSGSQMASLVLTRIVFPLVFVALVPVLRAVLLILSHHVGAYNLVPEVWPLVLVLIWSVPPPEGRMLWESVRFSLFLVLFLVLIRLRYGHLAELESFLLVWAAAGMWMTEPRSWLYLWRNFILPLFPIIAVGIAARGTLKPELQLITVCLGFGFLLGTVLKEPLASFLHMELASRPRFIMVACLAFALAVVVAFLTSQLHSADLEANALLTRHQVPSSALLEGMVAPARIIPVHGDPLGICDGKRAAFILGRNSGSTYTLLVPVVSGEAVQSEVLPLNSTQYVVASDRVSPQICTSASP